MIHDSQKTADQSVSDLVGEIINDTQQLVKQHLELLRHEVREDFRKSRRAALVMVSAHVLGVVGCAAMVAMLVGLLRWVAPSVAWWCWCGIVGAALLVCSALVYRNGKRLISTMNLMPNEIAKVLTENL